MKRIAESAGIIRTFRRKFRFPGHSQGPIPPHLMGIGLVLIAVIFNVIGIQPTARLNLALVIINIAILLLFVIFSLPAFDPGRILPLFSGGITGLLQATALLFFAYTGYARPVTLAEEIKEPRRVLPRAVSMAIALSAALYFGVALTALAPWDLRPWGRRKRP